MSDASDPRHANPQAYERCLLSDCKGADCPEHGYLPRRRLQARPEALAARGLAPTRMLLSVRLEDGTFESSLAISVDAEPAAVRATAVELINQALQVAKKR